MICKNCQCENNYNANYCKKCGQQFSDEQRKQAFDGTWAGQIEKFFEIVSWAKLEKITGNKIVRIGVIVVLLLTGLSNMMNHGVHFTIEDGQNYEILSSPENDSFVLLCEESSVTLQLYVPSGVQAITVKKMDDAKTVLSEHEYDVSDEIVLNVDHEGMYRIEAEYSSYVEEILVHLILEGE